MIERVGKFIKQGLDPNMVTLRVDPIVPGVTKIKDVDALIKRASDSLLTFCIVLRNFHCWFDSSYKCKKKGTNY